MYFYSHAGFSCRTITSLNELISSEVHELLHVNPTCMDYLLPQNRIRPYCEAAYISCWNVDERPFRKVIPHPQSIKRKFDVVYMNFAGLHMLHLHKARGWDPSYIKQLYHFEDMVAREVHNFRAIAERVVLMTPPRVCEERYYSQYKDWLDNSEREICTTCKNYVLSKASVAMKPPIAGRYNISDPEVAIELCRNYTMTENGSRHLAEDIIKAAAKLDNVTVFDFYNWTKGVDCSHAKDGRHYDKETLDLVEDKLVEVLGLKTVSAPIMELTVFNETDASFQVA